MSGKAKAKTLKESVEIAKLQEEIRSLRQQRFLAVLGIIGGVIAFLVSQTDKISQVIYQKPRSK